MAKVISYENHCMHLVNSMFLVNDNSTKIYEKVGCFNCDGENKECTNFEKLYKLEDMFY